MQHEEKDRVIASCTKMSVSIDSFQKKKFLHSDLGIKIFSDRLVETYVFSEVASLVPGFNGEVGILELLEPLAFRHVIDSPDVFEPNEALAIFHFIAKNRPKNTNGSPYSIVFFIKKRQDDTIGGVSMTTRGNDWEPRLIVYGSFLSKGTHVLVRECKNIYESQVLHS